MSILTHSRAIMARRVLHSLGATTRLNSTLAAVAAAPRFRITFAGNDEFSQIVLESLVDAKRTRRARRAPNHSPNNQTSGRRFT
jgi:hypothetical protein